MHLVLNHEKVYKLQTFVFVLQLMLDLLSILNLGSIHLRKKEENLKSKVYSDTKS